MTDVFEKRAVLNKRLLAAARGSGDIVELLIDPEYRDPDEEEDFLFDINCRDVLGNTPLHLAVSNESVGNVNLILDAPLCDVDMQNHKGDTPLHLAVQIRDPDIRKDIVTLLIEEAEAYDSTRLKNKANQTPKDLCDIYCPDDKEVVRLASPARKVNQMLDKNDVVRGKAIQDSSYYPIADRIIKDDSDDDELESE
ncbi:ankyrin repeat-containing domain protein [Pisolithus albus]|nr:ankyrin repeat-containing domain protein [Pisolithus albus]